MPRNLLPKESDTGRPEPHFRTSETCLETKHETHPLAGSLSFSQSGCQVLPW